MQQAYAIEENVSRNKKMTYEISTEYHYHESPDIFLYSSRIGSKLVEFLTIRKNSSFAR